MTTWWLLVVFTMIQGVDDPQVLSQAYESRGECEAHEEAIATMLDQDTDITGWMVNMPCQPVQEPTKS